MTAADPTAAVEAWLARGGSWTHPLPGGTLHFDRPLPYLFVCRATAEAPLTALVGGEAARLVVDPAHEAEVQPWVQALANALAARYQAFLLVEVWADPDATAAFEVHAPGERLPPVANTLADMLKKVNLPYQDTTVARCDSATGCAPGRPALLDAPAAGQNNLTVGVALRPAYQDAETGGVYPHVLRDLQRDLSRTFRRAIFDFVRVQTKAKPVHFHALGPRTLTDVALAVDRQLTKVGTAFEFLLLVSPTNLRAAWEGFQKKPERPPAFRYRLLPVDPNLLKRQLHQIPVEAVADPTLAAMFRDKQRELGRMLTLLADRGTPNFRYGSLQLFGGVDDALLSVAKGLMAALAYHGAPPPGQTLDAATFRDRAQAEMDYLAAQVADEEHIEMRSRAILRDDVSGLMVSEGQLYVGSAYRVAEHRAEALIQHEVGTHVLTYYNGRAQPLQLLYTGVPGYEELQEGLAVLSEYLVGGLTAVRLRVLAARVIAVDAMLRDATFAETYRLLHRTYGLKPFSAFQIVARAYRGGGLTKDIVYLRGLVELLDHLREGNPLEPLLIGKIRADYLDITQELTYRGVLRQTPIRPRYLDDPQAQARLQQLHQPGKTVFNLLDS